MKLDVCQMYFGQKIIYLKKNHTKKNKIHLQKEILNIFILTIMQQ